MQSCRDCLRKDKDILDLKEQLNRSNRYEHKRKCPECEMNEATVSSLHDHIKQLENQIADTSRQLDNLKQSLKKERSEKEDALTCLSSLASSELRDNNPNITNLSDQNRPTKIAEKMSELYDNEWTEAFDSLVQSKSETDIIVSLSGVLKEVFEICTRLAWTNFFENIQAAIYPNIQKEPLSDHFKQQVKEYRKLRAPGMTKHLLKVVREKIPRGMLPSQSKEMMAYFAKCLEVSWLAAVQDPPLALNFCPGEKFDTALFKDYNKRVGPYVEFLMIPQEQLSSQSRQVKAYFEKCVEVCWLAAVQDPPLELNFSPGEKFDTALFKDYTERGPYVEFQVWPALHLHEAGPLLTKGVAQGCQQNPYNHRIGIPSDQSLTPQNKQPRFNEEIRDADRQNYSRHVSSTK
ncbi:uncharacterized protein LOC128228481 [Mya arenaria]|uniref:uncharacterized protein LOC128228481 n=1 Tax=Mya arenaria TaxID=6604 RepID=UPI0022E8EF81|nr:uncharacterized protein LOC128228481 [Mya arenaria]